MKEIGKISLRIKLLIVYALVALVHLGVLIFKKLTIQNILMFFIPVPIVLFLFGWAAAKVYTKYSKTKLTVESVTEDIIKGRGLPSTNTIKEHFLQQAVPGVYDFYYGILDKIKSMAVEVGILTMIIGILLLTILVLIL